ncbi:EpsD family peptidyl-prolyl cis-trans isomerase [Massilia sp. TWP1-3-3]|uniref:EpsD family peptidyl-prolyl cis-trans isomerase n=1 Tax=Massilia sp. TWP1-3-3 TaxID=2804573 RepID=UPI003CF2143B
MNTNILALMLAAGLLVACSKNDAPAKPGQALASVNGKEITVLQLNEELQRANVQAAQQQGAGKQLLEALIDRQLLQNEAAREKLDRDPKVVQAIERAKSLIVAQAYMQKKIGGIDKPGAAEVSEYYGKHPEFFARRKQFDMQQLIIDTSELSDELKLAADKARTLDDVAGWLDARRIKYVRGEASRTTSDLAPELAARLASMTPGRLFVVKEGARSMLVSITGIKDSPASLALAAPQIEKFLMTKRGKEAADAELARLRAGARIEYLNLAALPGASQASAAAAGSPASPASPAGPTRSAAAGYEATARGVAGLK